jgi:hypothetical protein
LPVESGYDILLHRIRFLLFRQRRGYHILLPRGDADMKTQGDRPCNLLLITGLLTLFCILTVNSCNLPGDPGSGKGTLVLFLPETAPQEVPAQNQTGSRAVLSDEAFGRLVYEVTLTGPGEPQTLKAGGGGTTLYLDAGEWHIKAVAYDPDSGLPLDDPDKSVAAGSGEEVITVIAGRSASVKIPMTTDPVYERSLTEIHIHNEAELRRVETDFDIGGNLITHFYLENDIVLTEPWTPIGGGSDSPFRAEFDGQDHTITVRSFEGAKREGEAVYLGLFACTDETVIKNLTIIYELDGPVDMSVTDASVTDALDYESYAGGIAGYASNTTFENIGVTGTFSIKAEGAANLYLGGIAGNGNEASDRDVTITNCHVTGTVGGTSGNILYIGGIVGSITGSKEHDGNMVISGSSFTGTLSGNAGNSCLAGGIAGSLYYNGAEITGCFVEGRVRADGGGEVDAGGIAGYADIYYSRSINTSYAAGIVESKTSGSSSNAGGIIGRFYGPLTIENCYVWADVSTSSTSSETAGGIAGSSTGTITNCYAAGSVQSKGQNPDTYVGGIAGGSNDSGPVSGCMALVLKLDGGPSTSTSKTVYAIGYGAMPPTDTRFFNYSRDDLKIQNDTNDDYDYREFGQGGIQRPLKDFKSSDLYTRAGWSFGEAGDGVEKDGVWKFLDGYDYPVLSWQDKPPADPSTSSGVAE